MPFLSKAAITAAKDEAPTTGTTVTKRMYYILFNDAGNENCGAASVTGIYSTLEEAKAALRQIRDTHGEEWAAWDPETMEYELDEEWGTYTQRELEDDGLNLMKEPYAATFQIGYCDVALPAGDAA